MYVYCSQHSYCFLIARVGFFFFVLLKENKGQSDNLIFHFIKIVEENDITRNVKAKSYRYISFMSFCSKAIIFKTLLCMTQAMMSETEIFHLLLVWITTNILYIYFLSLN